MMKAKHEAADCRNIRLTKSETNVWQKFTNTLCWGRNWIIAIWMWFVD